jgi:hypothetical protein
MHDGLCRIRHTRRDLIAGALGIAAFLHGLRPAVAQQQERPMEGHVIEIVTFRLVEGADPARFLAASAAVDSFVRTQPGFVARRLSVGDDQTYVDHIQWSSLSAARTAAETVMTVPALAPFMQMIDPTGLTMAHNRLLTAVN